MWMLFSYFNYRANPKFCPGDERNTFFNSVFLKKECHPRAKEPLGDCRAGDLDHTGYLKSFINNLTASDPRPSSLRDTRPRMTTSSVIKLRMPQSFTEIVRVDPHVFKGPMPKFHAIVFKHKGVVGWCGKPHVIFDLLIQLPGAPARIAKG